jgi:hypothetical protein
MKLLNCFAPVSSVQRAKELFHRTWKITTRSILRNGPRSVSWIVCADLDGTGELPRNIVAAGVCDTEAQAREAMRQRFELWTLTGPTAMRVLGRSGW